MSEFIAHTFVKIFSYQEAFIRSRKPCFELARCYEKIAMVYFGGVWMRTSFWHHRWNHDRLCPPLCTFCRLSFLVYQRQNKLFRIWDASQDGWTYNNDMNLYTLFDMLHDWSHLCKARCYAFGGECHTTLKFKI